MFLKDDGSTKHSYILLLNKGPTIKKKSSTTFINLRVYGDLKIIGNLQIYRDLQRLLNIF